jgi:hypothetical protein
MNNERSPDFRPISPTPRPIAEYTYQGPLLFIVVIFIWALCGHIAIVLNQESSGLLEFIYLLGAIVSAMALNNRWHGFNHRIKFFADHMIVPKLFNPWFWREEIIYYRDINEIKFYGEQNSAFGQMHLVTNGPIYPILSKKLQGGTLAQIHQHITEIAHTFKIPSGHNSMPFEGAPSQQSGQKFLMIMAVLVSLVTIGTIITAGPYLSVLDGTRFFVMAFFLATMQTIALARMSASNNGASDSSDVADKEKTAAPTWHRRFLLGYLGLYSLIAWSFGLITINGALDKLPAERQVVQIVKVDENSEGPFCFEFAWGPEISDGRTPAAVHAPGPAGQKLEALCRKGPAIARPGEKLVLYKHQGALGEAWVSALAPLSSETVE